ALKEVLELDLRGLEAELKKFTGSSYLWTEELARQVGLPQECAESTYAGFETICRLKREGKPVSEKGQRIYDEILKRLERKLGAQKF
ncbi:MAG TPA: hypothetical protein VEN81_07780, partial [Planctomycetota bacterium]|nr:hypothetical protein [Planctomycetota bacterium]